MVSFSAQDLTRAGEVISRLMDPHGSESVDRWRSDINRLLIELLAADSAGFILPAAEGPLVYSDEHCADALARYPEMAPPALLSGKAIFERAVELGVSTLGDIWQEEMQRNLSSAYHNEYVAPNRAFDALSAVISVPKLGPHGMAGVQLWHDKPTGRTFGDRERALMRLIFPALRAGIEAKLRYERYHADFLSVLDALPESILVCDANGRPLHQTPALTAAMAEDPENSVLDSAMRALAVACVGVGSGAPRITAAVPAVGGRALATARAKYRISGSLYQSPAFGSPVLAIVSLTRLTPVRRADAELQEAYKLTPAELRVLALIVEARSSAEMANELALSRHTVRRHGESILLKTGARSRVELMSLILR